VIVMAGDQRPEQETSDRPEQEASDGPEAPSDRLEEVVGRYGALARAAAAGESVVDCGEDAFGEGCFGAAGYEGDEEAAGLPEGAVRASLGCGNPVAVAPLAPGDTVLDLGSGGGIDVLLSARRVAPGGKVYGLDATAEMISLARANARRAGVANVEFLHGRIEEIPLPDACVDAVVSNCVINLSADKPRVLAEAYRVLRSGGHFGVSDVLAHPGLTPARRAEAERAAGCATTLTADEYRQSLLAAGFTGAVVTPTADAGTGVYSAIVKAVRPPAPEGVVLRPMRARDAEAVLALYQAGIDEGDATFETAAPDWESFDAAKLPLHRYVAADGATGEVLGWVAAAPTSSREAYAGVVEHSVYVRGDARGRGIARALLDALIASTESAGVWTVQSGIFPENPASLALHRAAGFRVVGTRERVGRRDGTWRDVVLLERRSPVVD
jgi:L-amino acid N-acyltransferase YncA/ubiquinone/menaquinone biosynthesis C-methylase UbiE